MLATGFDAFTGALARIDIRGADGMALADAWREGPKTYLGLMSAGFPNLFMVTGPGSPSVLGNVVVSIEQHVEFIVALLRHLREADAAQVAPSAEAQDSWGEVVRTAAAATLFPHAASWYLGANVPGKPRQFMPLIGFPAYVEKCDAVAAAGYEGFALKGMKVLAAE